ncbi:hypothetical protein [Haloarcula sediminis]|uniref:hypothetical protein n=1 Tax=Haloarcula sediminis TaxID=3111777 RepID=UPI002D773457|nr:hypothetical protein [Haloarcula sp. CK38]
MVSEGLIGALGGALISGLLVGGFNYLNTTQKIESEDDRSVGEFYLERKVDALAKYHGELDRFVEEVRVYKNKAYDGRLSESEASEVIELFNSYRLAVSELSIFLTEKQEDTIDATLGPFKQASVHVIDKTEFDRPDEMTEESWNYKEVKKAAAEASGVVKAEIREGVGRLEED